MSPRSPLFPPQVHVTSPTPDPTSIDPPVPSLAPTPEAETSQPPTVVPSPLPSITPEEGGDSRGASTASMLSGDFLQLFGMAMGGVAAAGTLVCLGVKAARGKTERHPTSLGEIVGSPMASRQELVEWNGDKKHARRKSKDGADGEVLMDGVLPVMPAAGGGKGRAVGL